MLPWASCSDRNVRGKAGMTRHTVLALTENLLVLRDEDLRTYRMARVRD